MEVVTKKKKNIITYKKTNCRQGGCATVYDACYLGNDGFVIKILKSGSDHKKIARFKAEVRETIKLQDKVHGIIPILEYEIEQKDYWYLMPKAQPIRDHIESEKNKIVADDERNKEKISIIIKVKAVYDLVLTLRDLHNKNIHHRDIKPLNLYYYDGKYCFGDFGLIDYPKKEGVTTDTERVGPQGFMPDEMYRNTKNADYKKVDVYELAKTFWSILTEQPTVFHGKYDEDDKEIGVSNYFKYSHHLVEIEEILTQSTEFIPALRPSSEEFIKKIELWLKCIENQRYRSVRQWQYINSRLFPQIPPATASFTDLDDIVSVLSKFCKLPDLHTFMPNSGGLDFSDVKKAGEEGCIDINTQGYSIILKPKRLLIENIENDPLWSYARLEADTLEPKMPDDVSKISKSKYERLTEVLPGQYESWLLGNYGRDYDGQPLPQGAKIVERYLEGSFVLFNKATIYYNTSATYDSRHNILSAEKFRTLVNLMRIIHSLDKKIYKEKFDVPYPGTSMEESISRPINRPSGMEITAFENYVDNILPTEDFSLICDKYAAVEEGSAFFWVEAIIKTSRSNNRDMFEGYVLDCNCKILKTSFGLGGEPPHNAFLFSSFAAAAAASSEIRSYIVEKCNALGINNFDITLLNISFKHHVYRNFNVKPKHLFTLDEVLFSLRTGNDSKTNKLVVDTDGYCKLVNPENVPDFDEYPIYYEIFQPYNGYVGRFTDIENRNDEYNYFLYFWHEYLKYGVSQWEDYTPDFDMRELIDKIKAYY